MSDLIPILLDISANRVNSAGDHWHTKTYVDEAIDEIQSLTADNARLREALERIYDANSSAFINAIAKQALATGGE